VDKIPDVVPTKYTPDRFGAQQCLLQNMQCNLRVRLGFVVAINLKKTLSVVK
jgi:hypothetical protein